MNTDIDLRNCLLSNFCNLIPVHLDGSNYVTWKFLLETMLRGCGLMKYVDGSFPCPSQYMITKEGGVLSEMTAEYLTWKQNDYAVMTLLVATLSSGVLSFVVGSNTSRDLWCLLKERTSGHIAKLCRYKQQSQTSSQPKSASIAAQPSSCSSMPLISPG